MLKSDDVSTLAKRCYQVKKNICKLQSTKITMGDKRLCRKKWTIVIKQKVWHVWSPSGYLNQAFNSWWTAFQRLNNQICPGTFLKLQIDFLSRGGCYRELPRNVDRLPNICAQQCVDEGVGLCTRHNLHRTDHIRNYKQSISDSQLTAWIAESIIFFLEMFRRHSGKKHRW